MVFVEQRESSHKRAILPACTAEVGKIVFNGQVHFAGALR